ncbi:MAG: malonyl CoA-acyl carrier protein transacylase, partial [Pseudomonadota bacterium]
DVKSHDDAEAVREALVRQVCEPVLWVDTIEAMKQNDVSSILELGPGKVLAGLNRRIDRRMGVQPVFDQATLDKAIEQLNSGE